jgi:hypothetical protein
VVDDSQLAWRGRLQEDGRRTGERAQLTHVRERDNGSRLNDVTCTITHTQRDINTLAMDLTTVADQAEER